MKQSNQAAILYEGAHAAACCAKLAAVGTDIQAKLGHFISFVPFFSSSLSLSLNRSWLSSFLSFFFLSFFLFISFFLPLFSSFFLSPFPSFLLSKIPSSKDIMSNFQKRQLQSLQTRRSSSLQIQNFSVPPQVGSSAPWLVWRLHLCLSSGIIQNSQNGDRASIVYNLLTKKSGYSTF